MSIMQGVHLLIAKLRRKDNVPGGCFYATVEGPTPVEASPSPVAGAAGQAETGGTDTPDATGLVAGPMDKNAYRPANKIINEHPDVAKDIKALNRILAAHPEIRRWKPRQNRLSVHAGDWLKYVDAQAQGSQFMPEETHSPGAKPARPAAEAMRTGPGIQAWRCRSCQADYADQPRRCEKCGGGTFEPVIVRPSTPQQRRGK
ncbi:MAG TPA: hypothetical protein VHP11_10025 [Tepidisphaeraceae bacterium]|nr:hypothetical protein [Tepidisphaeraceae bacterium]